MHLPTYLASHGWPTKEIKLALDAKTLKTCTLEITSNKVVGNHRDPPTPTFAAVGGHSNYALKDRKFIQKQRGGNLFLVDGMFRLDYGPRDLILFDGNVAHGVTNMRHLPNGQGKLNRFSSITFSTWKIEHLKQPGNYNGDY